jgi:hypothetical protein
MQITDYPTVYSALDISVPHMMPTAFRAVSTARRLGGSDGRMPGNPRATSALLVARSAGVTPGTSRVAVRVAGRSAAKASGTTRSILDGCNVVDGTTTPIVMSPSSRRYLGGVRTRGDAVAPVTTGGPRAGGEGVPARGRRRPRVSARSVTSSSCAWRAPSPYRVVVVEPGHQFQLRTAVPLGRRGFLEVSVVTSSSCALPFLPGRRGFSDVAAVTGYRCAAVRLRARVCAAVTRSSCASRTFLREPPGDGPEGLHASPPLRVVR